MNCQHLTLDVAVSGLEVMLNRVHNPFGLGNNQNIAESIARDVIQFRHKFSRHAELNRCEWRRSTRRWTTEEFCECSNAAFEHNKRCKKRDRIYADSLFFDMLKKRGEGRWVFQFIVDGSVTKP